MEELKYKELLHLLEGIQTDLLSNVERTVNSALVLRNWLFGYHIVEYQQNGKDRAEYGDKLLLSLSKELKKIGMKGVSETRLRLFRKFYIHYSTIQPTLSAEFQDLDNKGNEGKVAGSASIGPTLSDQLEKTQTVTAQIHNLQQVFKLSWSHYVTLLTIDNPNERRFYEIEAEQNSWRVRELKRQIESSLYQRLALSKDKDEVRRLATEGHVVESAADIIKNPLVLEFLGIEEKSSYSETDLESAIISELETFLLELGKGFLFEARQKRFTFDDDHFYVDLVFYNRLLRSYVLIDLKRDKLTHQDLGQMQMYVNYFDRYVKTEDESPTIGIVLCHRKNDALVELTLPKESNIYASKYQLYLPSKEELQQKLIQIESKLLD